MEGFKGLDLVDRMPEEVWMEVCNTEYIMRNAGLEEAQAGIKFAGRNTNNLIYADDTTFMAGNEEELKELLDGSERRERKSWLKTQHSEN